MGTPVSSRFDIDDTLLADDTQGWSNLGDWEHAAQYAQAAAALASRVAGAAGLSPRSDTTPGQAPRRTLLELAIGNGAGLRHWHSHYGIERLAGIDIRPGCINAAQASLPEALQHNATLAGAGFDTGGLPAEMAAHGFDHVVCVDAAYHARSARDFLTTARLAMNAGAGLGFSTLIHAKSQKPSAHLTAGLALAGIPSASILSEQGWRDALAQQGLCLTSLEDRTQAVLGGFADYIENRRSQLTARQKLSTGWLKIASTAWLCRTLTRGDTLRYVIVGARLLASPSQSVRR